MLAHWLLKFIYLSLSLLGVTACARIEPPADGFMFVESSTFTCGGNSRKVDIFLHTPTGLEFVHVPGGTILMRGQVEPESLSLTGNTSRCIKLKSFLLCRTLVTQNAYERITKSNPNNLCGKRYPVDRISWDGAREWCKLAGLRLPSEAEWEYACRAGTATDFYFGNDYGCLGDYEWFRDNSNLSAKPVGMKLPNAFGLFDMAGNLSEWVEDDFRDPPYFPSDGAPFIGGGSFRVIRGGHWFSKSDALRSSSRRSGLFNLQSDTVGFRPAATIHHGREF